MAVKLRGEAGMGRVGASVLLAAMAALAGCSWLGGGTVEADALSRWAIAHAEPVGDPKIYAAGDAKARVAATADGKGVAMTSADPKQPMPELRLYLVPLAQLDPALDARLRGTLFPGGTATFAAGEEKAPKRKLAESELEQLYLQFTIQPGNALCADFTRPCDAATVSVVGKLKGRPLAGRGSRSIGLTPAADPERLMGAQAPDAQALCGFDPLRDRLPTHIATGCNHQRWLRWAVAHGFTLGGPGGLIPLSPEALKAWLTAWLGQPLYKDGVVDGALVEGK
jgi:hypothetical protein